MMGAGAAGQGSGASVLSPCLRGKCQNRSDISGASVPPLITELFRIPRCPIVTPHVFFL